jgi:SAM-dependent methyltransferase
VEADVAFERIREHWRQVAEAVDPADLAHAPTSSDPHMRDLELHAILPRLRPGDRVLDVGCGTGLSAFQFAARCQRVLAVDYAEALIEKARAAQAHRGGPPNLEFRVASLLGEEPLPPGPFDVVVSQRCLINLPHWEAQRQALGRIARLLAPGGRLLMVEGVLEPLERLNALRTAVGLEPIKVVWYNCFFQEAQLEAELRRYFTITAAEGLGLYLYLTRILHPLIVAPEAPRHDSPINAVARRLVEATPGDPFADLGYNRLYVCTRRE